MFISILFVKFQICEVIFVSYFLTHCMCILLGKPVVSCFLTPSVSPMNLTGLGAFQPRIRLFEFSRSSSLELMNYHQLYLDISAVSPTPSWQVEYAARPTFNLGDLAPQTLSNLLSDFHANETKFSLYWKYQLGLHMEHSSGSYPPLGSARRCLHLCAMAYLEYGPLDACLDRCPAQPVLTSLVSADHSDMVTALSLTPANTTLATSASTWNTLPFIAAVIIAFLVILIGIVFLVNREICRRRLCSTQAVGASAPERLMVHSFGVGGANSGSVIDNSALLGYSSFQGDQVC